MKIACSRHIFASYIILFHSCKWTRHHHITSSPPVYPIRTRCIWNPEIVVSKPQFHAETIWLVFPMKAPEPIVWRQIRRCFTIIPLAKGYLIIFPSFRKKNTKTKTFDANMHKSTISSKLFAKKFIFNESFINGYIKLVQIFWFFSLHGNNMMFCIYSKFK